MVKEKSIADVIEDMQKKGKIKDAEKLSELPATEFINHFEEIDSKTNKRKVKWGSILEDREALRIQIQHMLWNSGISPEDQICWKVNAKKGELIIFK